MHNMKHAGIVNLALGLLLSLALAGCFAGSAAPAPNAEVLVASPMPQDRGALMAATPVAVAQAEGAAEVSVDVGGVPHPMSIEALRSRSYEGSDFVIEQVLEPGSNYDRYVVSYLSDGLKIYAMMTIPRAEKPPTGFPVVIFNHGYIPPAEYRTTERYVAYVDAFARSGYIVIKSDYRGHGSSEGDAESAYGSPAYVIDVLNALASARRYPDADPNRVGMWGHSMGGYITLRAMVADQNIKAGVIWAGVVASYHDLFESWFGRGGSGRSSGWRSSLIEQYGTPSDNPAFWNGLSANSYLADLTGPVQIHHGTNDTTVPYAYSVTLDEQIRAAGKTTELFLYPRDDHNIATNRDDALTLSVAFFHQHVRGLE